MPELFLHYNGAATSGPYHREKIREHVAAKLPGWDFAAEVYSLAGREWSTVGEILDEPEPDPCVNRDCFVVDHTLLDSAGLRERWRTGLDPETRVFQMGEQVVPGGGSRDVPLRRLIAETRRLDCSSEVTVLRFFQWLGFCAVLVRLLLRLIEAWRSTALDFWAVDQNSLVTLGLLVVVLGIVIAVRVLLMLEVAGSCLARYAAAPPPGEHPTDTESKTKWDQLLNATAARKGKGRKR